MPYATAAKFAHSDRCVVCTIGDGAFQMLGMNELITVKKYLSKWDNPQFIVMVLHNNDLTQVSWEMRTEDANPVWFCLPGRGVGGLRRLGGTVGFQRDPSQERRRCRSGLGCGVRASRSDPDRRIHQQERAAVAAEDLMEFAKNTAKALLHGDPDEVDVVRDSAKAVASEGVERIKGKLILWIPVQMTPPNSSLLDLVMMSFRKVNASTIIVRSKIMAVQADFNGGFLPITTRALKPAWRGAMFPA